MANVELKKDFKDGQFLYGDDLNNNFKVIEAGINANEEELSNYITAASEELKEDLMDITAQRGWDWENSNGERVTFYKGNTEQINNYESHSGQLLYNTETGETYLDDNGKLILTGSGNILKVSEEEPTNPGTKVWINPNELQKVDSTEVIDSLEGNETNLAPSVRSVKNALSYSIEEKVIGTWIDSKPLYRKVVTGDISNGTTLLSNVDTLIDVKGTGWLSDLARVIPYYEIYNNTAFTLTCQKNSANEVVLLARHLGNDSISYNSNIILEYTKTTD